MQELHLAGEPEQHLAVRSGPAGRRPLHHHATERGLQGADPLAHRGGRDVQVAGGRLERALVGDRDQRGELGGHDLH